MVCRGQLSRGSCSYHPLAQAVPLILLDPSSCSLMLHQCQQGQGPFRPFWSIWLVGVGSGEGCGRCGFCTKLSLLILRDPEGMFHRTQCSCQRLKPQTLRIGMLRHSGSLKGSLILKPSPAHGNGMHQKAGSPIKPPDAGYFDVAA